MRVVTQSSVLAAVVVLMSFSAAQAHFLWLGFSPSDSEVQLWFSEGPEPGEAHLVDRVKGAKVWSFSEKKPGELVALTAKVGEDSGELVGKLSQKQTSRVEASHLYGVYKSMWLHYDAKYVSSHGMKNKKLAAGKNLQLDIVPQKEAKGFRFQVLYQGKPLANAKLALQGEDGDSAEITTDKKGLTRLVSIGAGRYGLMARHAEPSEGKLGDKEYKQKLYISTLTLDVHPEGKLSAAKGDSQNVKTNVKAADLLHNAKQSRALWNDFPGFSAKINVYDGKESLSGTITVTSDGDIEAKGFDLEKHKSLSSSLKSMVSHRMSSVDYEEDVSYPNKVTNHPQGRLVKLEYDTSMGSTYRVKDSVIHQVNRKMGPGRFAIDVISVYRNPEGKYLPEVFVVNFWNKDGALQSSSTTQDMWVRVGKFDLPKSHFVVRAGKDEQNFMRVDFSNHKLLTANKSE